MIETDNTIYVFGICLVINKNFCGRIKESWQSFTPSQPQFLTKESLPHEDYLMSMIGTNKIDMEMVRCGRFRKFPRTCMRGV